MEDDSGDFNIPEITPVELAERMQAEPDLLLLDVRERFEVARARINDPRVWVVPLSELAQHQLEALPVQAQDRSAALVVFCHLGMRSAQVVEWLRGQGWQNVANLSGGIDAYARQVDPQIDRY